MLVSLPFFLGGALLTLYGIFALLYRGEGRRPGATYVKLSGHRFDAHAVGALSVLIGLAVVAAGALILRRFRT